MLALSLALHACGGGVEGQGTGSFSYVQGPISGFGSIIVNGVEFDDRTATVTDEDGNRLSTADLKLGMTVSVDSGAIDAALGTATAQAVQVHSALTGPVSARDAAAGTLRILGHTVRVGTATVFDERLATGLAAVAVGDVLEVHALYDEVENLYVARRVAPHAVLTLYRVAGPVSALDTATRTFRIGSQTYVDTAGGLLAGLVNGQMARVRVQPAADSLGRWVVGAAQAAPRTAPDGAEAEVEGLIGPDLAAGRFLLDGISVNAATATVEPAGTVLAAGQRVEVEGRMSGGVLQASKVKVKSRDDKGEDDDGEFTKFEVKGLIEAVDTASSTFRVRGTTIHWSASVRFKDGTAADLVVGRKVEVKGLLSSTGTVVEATEIQIDD